MIFMSDRSVQNCIVKLYPSPHLFLTQFAAYRIKATFVWTAGRFKVNLSCMNFPFNTTYSLLPTIIAVLKSNPGILTCRVHNLSKRLDLARLSESTFCPHLSFSVSHNTHCI